MNAIETYWTAYNAAWAAMDKTMPIDANAIVAEAVAAVEKNVRAQTLREAAGVCEMLADESTAIPNAYDCRTVLLNMAAAPGERDGGKC